MAFDGIFLSRVKNEIESAAIGARVDKIAQPTREEIVLHLRWRGDGGRLLLSASAGSPRVHFTNIALENPMAPPMFCMLLRKHLSGAKLMAVRQVGLDRVLHLDFETTNELGDIVTLTLALEIMGRHSNIILIGSDGRVVDAVKRVDMETSSVRQVLPGMRYELPPAQDKLSLAEANADEVIERIKQGRDVELSKALMDALQGVSPVVCREAAHYAARGAEITVSELTGAHFERLRFFLDGLGDTIKNGLCTPTLVAELSGRPRDFSFIPVTQYGALMLTRQYDTCGGLLDAFYSERDRMERIKQRSGDLLKLLANTSDRIRRKIALQREELKECANRGRLKIKGDLLNANLYAIQKGDRVAKLQNFYEPENPVMEIELDARLTPPQNAQRYYALYRKTGNAEKKLASLIEENERELLYIDSVFDALTRATGISDLEAIRDELVQSKYIKRSPKSPKAQKHEKLLPLRFMSTDGFTILAGRNNIQNDRLTLKESGGGDIWLHTQKIHGAHVVIVTNGGNVPNKTIEQACIIAAYHSQARESSKVPVDYTLARHVKKPAGAKPGMVVYANYQTVIVDPDAELVRSLAVK